MQANRTLQVIVAFWALLSVVLLAIGAPALFVIPVLVVAVLQTFAYIQVHSRGEAGSTPWLPVATWTSLAAAFLCLLPIIVGGPLLLLGVDFQGCVDSCDPEGGPDVMGFFLLTIMAWITAAALAAVAWLVYLVQLFLRSRATTEPVSPT